MMRKLKVKKIRKHIASLNLDIDAGNRLYKGMKKCPQTCAVVQSVNTNLFKKRHAGESFADFKDRRRVCNAKRRQREKGGQNG